MFKKLQTISKTLTTVQKAKNSILIRGGTVINADRQYKGDVAIENGKVSRVYLPDDKIHTQKNFSKVYDATNKLLLPGGIDPHVHLELPFMGTTSIDDFDKGSRAAAAGGTTTYIDFIIPGPEGLIAAYNDLHAKANKKTNVDYALHCVITDWNDKIREEMGEIVKRGVQSFKVFMAYKGTSFYQDDERLLQIFARAKELGAIVMVHAENGVLISHNQERLIKQGVLGPEGHPLSRTDEVEAEATHTAITIAHEINVPLYVVHVMKKSAAKEIRRAKKKGYVVFAEALAVGLGEDGRHYWNEDWDHAAGYVMSPAIDDDPTTKDFLMNLISTHDIDTTATDNCTFTQQQKRMGHSCFSKIPNGCNGLEDRLSVIWDKGVNTGKLTMSDFVRVTSANSAKIFNMYPRKGVIQEGSDADIIIFDPKATKTISRHTHHQVVDFNVFEGMKVIGVPQTCLLSGKEVFHEGKLNVTPGTGKYISRDVHGYSYERIPYLDKMKAIRETPVNRDKKDQKSKDQQISELSKQVDVSLERIKNLEKKLSEASQAKNDKGHSHEHSHEHQHQVWSSQYPGQIDSVEKVLSSYIPEKEHEAVRSILYGNKVQNLQIPQAALDIAKKRNFEIAGYKMQVINEQLRQPRLVRVGAVQNSIKAPTTAPVKEQLQALLDWMRDVVHAAHLSGVNVLGLQELWNAPFFLCTREKYPWVEFAEDFETGPTAQLFKELSAKYNMVIVSPILERDSVKETLHNSAVVFSQGKILGRQHKVHIPRVGDFNESTYYMEGELGHPIFETPFGRIGINICYGRHHPLHWYGLAINGAEIVFNPSATVNGLSEAMWPIEARCAAIANHYYVVGINRVGTEQYPNPFTSGDGQAPKHHFGMFYGTSHVCGPDASRTPALSRTSDGLLVTEIDLNQCRQVKDKWGFEMTRRMDLYANLLSQASKDGYQPQRVK